MKLAMKLGLAVALALATVPGADAQVFSSRLPRTNLFGREYVRLDDWARQQGGTARWTIPHQEVKVSLGSGVFAFTVDNRKATLKGTTVWLSYPVAFKNGSAYLGASDVVTALNPIVAPPRNLANRPVRTIVLDPGHGGRDPGNQEGKRQEKQFTLSFAKEVADSLTKAGFTVSLTRDGDSTLDLPVRTELARRRGADLFLCLHFNSADGPGAATVKGTEVYCMTPVRASSTNARGEGAGAGPYSGNRFDAKNMLLAFQIQKAVTEKLGMEDRGVKRARFQVLREAEMPAVLIESAFMTHAGDAKRIYDPALRRPLAQAVVDGVLAYKRIVERK
jgi:N-acetylmuramoyl-L-alanine amidase